MDLTIWLIQYYNVDNYFMKAYTHQGSLKECCAKNRFSYH